MAVRALAVWAREAEHLGGGWVNVLNPPRNLLDKYVILGTGTSGFGDLDGVRRVDVDPSRPFFLTGARGRGHIRVLGRGGDVLQDRKGERLEWDIGDDPR